MAVYWDKSVPLPNAKGVIINRGDMNRVLFVKEAPYDAKAGYAKPKRNTIGYVCDNDTKMMHPTDGYKQIFPSLWEKYFNEKVPAVFRRIGMYAMAEAVNGMTGIKDIMDECFGEPVANSMMDFVLYSLLFHTNAADTFELKMKDQQLFGGFCSDSYFSELFNRKISYEQILKFKKKWALQCKEDGCEEVWLCIDGSNDDCECKGVEIAEKGHAKSHRNRNIVSFTYAVTQDGKPITFDLYRGGLVDAKAMKRITDFLKEAGIKVRGVILDRGYCDGETLKYLVEKNIPYVIMVKGAPAGHTNIVEQYGNAIKMSAEYLVRGTFLFGVQEKVQLFEKYKHDDFLTLFYDYRNGSDRVTALLRNLYREIERVEKSLSKKESVTVISKFADTLTISDNRKNVEINSKGLQRLLDDKGLYSIVTSEEMTPQKVNALYQARNSSETVYMVVKTQLGYGKVRMHVTRGVQSKFTVGFIASCIRDVLQDAAESVNRTTNEVLQELNMLSMTKVGDSYVPIQGIAGRQEDILKKLDSSSSILQQIATDENDRLAGRKPTPRHRKPGPSSRKPIKPDLLNKPFDADIQPEEKKKRASTETRSRKERKKPGVKAGSKRGIINKDGSPRKKPGVQKGYKYGATKKDGSPRKKPGPKPKKDD